MLKGRWFAAIALGLTLSGATLGQEAQKPPIDRHQAQRDSSPTDHGDRKPEPEKPNAYNFTPALEKIEAAIRSLKAEVDAGEATRKNKHEQADLVAQQEMSRWAWWMMIPTWITTALTGAALYAILRTLHHTRLAANASVAMVELANFTNEAAGRAAAAAEKAYLAEQRPWLKIERVDLVGPDDLTDFHIALTVENVGRTVALDVIVIAEFERRKIPIKGIDRMSSFVDAHVGNSARSWRSTGVFPGGEKTTLREYITEDGAGVITHALNAGCGTVRRHSSSMSGYCGGALPNLLTILG